MCGKKQPGGQGARRISPDPSETEAAKLLRAESLRKLRQNWENDARLPKR